MASTIVRIDNQVLVRDKGEGEILPVGAQIGNWFVKGDIEYTYEIPTQTRLCFCGRCKGLNWHHPPGSTLIECGSGFNPALAPDLIQDGKARYEMGARTEEDCLRLWDEKKVIAGALRNPSIEHPEWGNRFNRYNKWGQYLGIPDYITTDELLNLLHSNYIEERLAWTREATHAATVEIRSAFQNLLLAVIGDYGGCLDACAKKLNLSVETLIQRLCDCKNDDERRQLLETPKEPETPKVSPPDTCPKPEDIPTSIKKLDKLMRTYPSGYYGTAANIPEMLIQQMNQLLWMHLEFHGLERLQQCLAECMTDTRKQFTTLFEQVKRYRTENRNWMQAYCVYWFAHSGHLLGFNLSEAGAGKTSTVYAIAKELELENVLILGTKSTIDNDNDNDSQWKLMAKRENEHRQNIFNCRDVFDLKKLESKRRNYVLVTEYTVQNNPDLIDQLSKIRWDMIVTDEPQVFSGSNDDIDSTKRLNHYCRLISAAIQLNPRCLRYLMSATPIRCEAEELIRVLEIVSGDELKNATGEGVSGLLKLRLFLFRNGFRFYINPNLLPIVKPITLGVYEEVELFEDPVVNCVIMAQYQSNILSEGRTILDMEVEMLPRQCEIIESNPVLKKAFVEASCPILYTQFTDTKSNRIVFVLKEWAEKMRPGYPVYIYTGMHKQDKLLKIIKRHKGKCTLIASAPLSVGLDGLQNLSDTMFIMGSPWHYANFEQLHRRIRRIGSPFLNSGVACIVMLAKDAEYHENRWSRLCQRRRSSLVVLDGTIVPINPKRIEQEYLRNKDNILRLSGVEVTPAATVVDITTPLKPRKYTPPRTVMMDVHRLYANSHSATLPPKRQGDLLIATTGRTYNLAEYHAANELTSKAYKLVYDTFVVKSTNLRILSLGCGTTEPKYAQELGLQNVTFVDMLLTEEAYIEYPQILRLDRNATKLPDGSFDLIVSVLSIFRLDYERSIREMARLLAPKGRAIIIESYQSEKAGGKLWVRENLTKAFKLNGLKFKEPKQMPNRHLLFEIRKGR